MLGTLALPQTSYCSTGISLTSSVETSTDGKFVLSWQTPDSGSVELQQQGVNLADYQTIYMGSDTASVITGLADGDYSYRMRTVSAQGAHSNWTTPVSVTVRHHTLPRAFGFFAVGAIVFISTIVLIVLGTRGRLGSEQERES